MSPFRRAGRPGLIGLAARTAVVAGTATAVSGSMARNQQAHAQARANSQQLQDAQQQAQIDAAAQAAVAQAAAFAPPAAAPAAPAVDIVAELQKLGALHEAGILNADEFTAAKAKLLS